MDFIISTEEKLQERIKELSCLYEVSSIIVQHQESISITLDKICAVLKQAWRFNNDSIVELQLDNYYHLTSVIDGSTVFQEVDVFIFNEKKVLSEFITQPTVFLKNIF